MPFTGSHPAAVLPLLGVGLPTSALVIGSLTPDLPYYVPVPVSAAHTHSITGAFGVDLVLGLVVLLVWRLVLVPPLLWAAPAGVQLRLPPQLRGSPTIQSQVLVTVARACAALVIGAVTHIAWDSFTHSTGWGLELLPWLRTPYLGLPLFRWLHLASSLAGLALLGAFLLRWWHRAPLVGRAHPVHPGIRWGLPMLLIGWAGWAGSEVAARLALAPGRASRQLVVIEWIVEFISTLMMGLLAAALVWHISQAALARLRRTSSGVS